MEITEAGSEEVKEGRLFDLAILIIALGIGLPVGLSLIQFTILAVANEQVDRGTKAQIFEAVNKLAEQISAEQRKQKLERQKFTKPWFHWQVPGQILEQTLDKKLP